MIIFLIKFFNIILTIKKEKIIKILNVKVLNLRIKIKFAILNNCYSSRARARWNYDYCILNENFI